MKSTTLSQEIRVGVLGLGHMGLPTAVALAELGWPVVGADPDKARVERISAGNSPFYEPGLEEMLQRHLGISLRVTQDVADAVRESTVLFICVGTPPNRDGSPDLSQVEEVGQTIAQNLNGYKLVVEKSTVPVLTAQRLRCSIARYVTKVASSGQRTEFDVASNPEFLREGKALQDFLHPHRVVLGADSRRARDLLLLLYEPLIRRGLPRDRILLTDTRTAELIKQAANAFLATKVSFINLIADLCEATGADVTEVARALGLDPRIGPHYLQAGVGYGGYCLPKDLRAFIRVFHEHGLDPGLLEAVYQVNESRVDRLLSKVKSALWVLKGKRLAVWGLAFKPGTDTVWDAPSLKVVPRLVEEGAFVNLYDPKAVEEFKRHLGERERIAYCSSALEAVEGAEALLLLTEWPEFLQVDFSEVLRRMKLPIVIDGRNFLDRNALRALGFEYYGVGRPASVG